MSAKPIFLATHPRSCSTAFERVFMTRSDLECLHEPFSVAFYYGPDRLSSRFANDTNARQRSGFSASTYQHILESLREKTSEGKRLFIKDMAYHICPERTSPQVGMSTVQTAETLMRRLDQACTDRMKDLPDEPVDGTTDEDRCQRNPTIFPLATLAEFQFVFLIRHPRHSIPSYFRCCRPPLDKVTGFYDFLPSEAGYYELRNLFEYLRSIGQICSEAPASCDEPDEDCIDSSATINGAEIARQRSSGPKVCVIDADDLLDKPEAIVEGFCDSVGLTFDPGMLKWDKAEHQKQAKDAFEKWPGFHEDAMNSNDLKPRVHHKTVKPIDIENAEWREKYGEAGAEIIRETVTANVGHYEYLKQFAMQV